MSCLCARCHRTLAKPAEMRGGHAYGPKCAAALKRQAKTAAVDQLSLWPDEPVRLVPQAVPTEDDDMAPVRRVVPATGAAKLTLMAVSSVFDLGRVGRLHYSGRTRGKYGERHPKAVLTDDQVREMRERRFRGVTLAQLAIDYDIPKVSVWSICTGRTRAVAWPQGEE